MGRRDNLHILPAVLPTIPYLRFFLPTSRRQIEETRTHFLRLIVEVIPPARMCAAETGMNAYHVNSAPGSPRLSQITQQTHTCLVMTACRSADDDLR